MLKPMRLADVRKHTGVDLSLEQAKTYANQGDPFLYNMACALSMLTWSNTPEEWLRLQAALVVLRHKKSHSDAPCGRPRRSMAI